MPVPGDGGTLAPGSAGPPRSSQPTGDKNAHDAKTVGHPRPDHARFPPALFGVYGMPGIGLMPFSLRLVPARGEWEDKLAPVGAPAKEASGA